MPDGVVRAVAVRCMVVETARQWVVIGAGIPARGCLAHPEPWIRMLPARGRDHLALRALLQGRRIFQALTRVIQRNSFSLIPILIM